MVGVTAVTARCDCAALQAEIERLKAEIEVDEQLIRDLVQVPGQDDGARLVIRVARWLVDHPQDGE